MNTQTQQQNTNTQNTNTQPHHQTLVQESTAAAAATAAAAGTNSSHGPSTESADTHGVAGEAEGREPPSTFDEMDLKHGLLRGIFAYGFENPSTIQKKAIPQILTGRDTIAQAQSGTGKTATFSISILQSIDESRNVTQAVVLAPTRELAEQSAQVMRAFAGPHMQQVQVQLLIGGRQTRLDRQQLRTGPQVVVGTPGRVMHMIRGGDLRLDHCSMFCLDEADQMLSFGFKDQVYDIFRCLPDASQIILVSATMPADVLELSTRFMREPNRILLQKDEVALEGIRQFYVALDSEQQKFGTLCDLYSILSLGSSIVFCNTKRQVEELHKNLVDEQFSVSKIHGEMPQADRDLALSNFRMGASRVLLSTDVLAKGIDVQSVALVINYNLPRQKEYYIHRIGRAGRFGRRGVAVNLATVQELKFLRDVESHYETVVEPMPMALRETPADFFGA